MDRYVGVDAHAETCTLAVMSASGKHLTSRVVETNGRALVEAIQSISGSLHVCLEEGTQSAWLYELFEPRVTEVVVTMAPETRGAKDDLRDAWTRANELRTGALRTRVYKAPKHLAALRSATRAYQVATQDVVRVKNRLKAVFRARGVLASADVYEAEVRGKWVSRLPSGPRQLAEWLGRELDQLVPLRAEAEAWLLKEAKAHPIIRKLSTAPGMGPIRSAQTVAIVATPDRFRTVRQFWSYCGLAVVTRSSSDWVRTKSGRWVRSEVQQTRGLTRKRQPVLKALFKGAATTVIAQLRSGPLHADYQRLLANGLRPNLAKLTLARRIAGIVLSMWRHKEVYDPRRNAEAVAKA
jgi:transposase